MLDASELADLRGTQTSAMDQTVSIVRPGPHTRTATGGQTPVPTTIVASSPARIASAGPSKIAERRGELVTVLTWNVSLPYGTGPVQDGDEIHTTAGGRVLVVQSVSDVSSYSTVTRCMCLEVRSL